MRPARASIAVTVALIGLLAAIPDDAVAQQQGPQDFEETFERPTENDELFSLRALFGYDTEYERNFNLDKDDNEDAIAVEPILRVGATYRPSNTFTAFVEFEMKANFEHARNEGSEIDPSLNVNQAYIALDDLVLDDSIVRVGRALFRDDREWLLDENLDGVRLLYHGSKLELDASVTRENLVRRDLLHRNSRRERIDNYALIGSYEVSDDFRLGGYVVMRDDRSAENEEGRPVIIGLRSRGELFDNFEQWADVATVRGDDGEHKLRGYAMAAGGTYTLENAPLKPRLTLGYAWGSGDEDPDEGTNREFRQTGLQSNEGRFGDSAKFKYYGEALDPELSNLHIFTAGIGANPTDRLSFDLVYHRYRQDKVLDKLRDVAIDLDPNEDDDRLSKDIGDEIDLIILFRPSSKVELEFAAGYFMSGSAFRIERDDDVFERAGDGYFARFEVDIRF